MTKRLIIFLIRRRLGLKDRETFRFVGQKSNAVYYFAKTGVMKVHMGVTSPSNVSLYWLLNDECKIKDIGVMTW